MKALTSLTLGLLGSVLACASPNKSARKPVQDGNEATPVDGLWAVPPDGAPHPYRNGCYGSPPFAPANE